MTEMQTVEVVVGAGTMGSGIAHVFARAGFHVLLCDVEQRFLDRANQLDSLQPGPLRPPKASWPSEKFESGPGSHPAHTDREALWPGRLRELKLPRSALN